MTLTKEQSSNKERYEAAKTSEIVAIIRMAMSQGCIRPCHVFDAVDEIICRAEAAEAQVSKVKPALEHLCRKIDDVIDLNKELLGKKAKDKVDSLRKENEEMLDAIVRISNWCAQDLAECCPTGNYEKTLGPERRKRICENIMKRAEKRIKEKNGDAGKR